MIICCVNYPYLLQLLESDSEFTALVDINLGGGSDDPYFICLFTNDEYIHQGSENFLQITTYARLLPLWLQVTRIVKFALTF